MDIKENAPKGATHYYIVNKFDVLYVFADIKNSLYIWNPHQGFWDYTTKDQYNFLCKVLKPI